MRQGLHFDLWYDGQWNEQLDDRDPEYTAIYARDVVTVIRGIDTPGAQAVAATCSLTLRDPDGRYSPRNIASPLYGKIGRNTPCRLRLDVEPYGTDSFTRTETDTWGTDPVFGLYNHVWTSGGLTNFSVSGGSGRHYVPSASTYSGTYLKGVVADDPDVTVLVDFPLPTGGDLETGLLLMMRSSTVYYMARAEVATSGAITLSLYLLDGGQTTLATTATGVTFDGTPLHLRAQRDGDVLRAKVWEDGGAEPDWQVSATDGTLVAPGWVGIRSGRGAGNSNTTNPQFLYDALTITAGSTRFTGEVSSWKPGKTTGFNVATGTSGDAWCKIQAAGVLRRIGRGKDPLRPVAWSAMVADQEYASSTVAVWPLDESTGATVLGSPTGAGAPSFGGLSLGAYTSHPATTRMVTFAAGGQIFASVPPYTSSEHEIFALWAIPAAGLTDNAVLIRAYCTGGTIDFLDVRYNTGFGGLLSIHAYAGGVEVSASSNIDFNVDGLVGAISLELVQDGADIDTRMVVMYFDDTTTLWDHTVSGRTVGRISHITLGQSDITGASVGYLGVGSDKDDAFANLILPIDSSGAKGVSGYLHELADQRFLRMCRQAGIPASVRAGASGTGRAMGPQRALNLLDTFGEIERTDDGQILEPRSSRALTMITGASKLNPPSGMVIDRDGGAVVPGSLELVIGDEHVRNDVGAKNWSGAEGRAVQETGPNNVADPADDPDGVGRYTTQIDVNIDDDAMLPSVAGARLVRGTYAGPWYKRVTLDLDAAPELAAAAGLLDAGSAVLLTNLPPDESPDDVPHLVIGTSEECGTHRRKLTLYLEPAAPYEVGELDDEGFLDCGDSELLIAVDDDDTTLLVAPADGCAWTTGAVTLPLMLGSEPATATAIAAPAPVFVAAGTVAHADNAAVVPGLPPGLIEGDLLVMPAAIRDTTAYVDSVTEPGGWDTVAPWSNFRVHTRIYRAADFPGGVGPTVTPAGGGAGDVLSARIAAFRGVQSLVTGTATSDNTAPASSIAYAALAVARSYQLVLLAGHKVDDHTGVSAVAGFTEAFDSFTAIGGGQSMFLQYQTQSTPTSIAAGSVTASGAVSAASRSTMLALDGTVQSVTVTRGTGGTSAAWPAGTAVTVAEPVVVAYS